MLLLFKIFIVKLNGCILKVLEEFVILFWFVMFVDNDNFFVFGYWIVKVVCELVLNWIGKVCGVSFSWCLLLLLISSRVLE